MTQPTARQTPVLVSDFDGTMTRNDFYRVAMARLAPTAPDYWEDYRAGRMTHFEALCHIFTHIRADEDTVMAAAREMELDPNLGESVTRLQQAGWEIIIASAGCDWYITRLLASQGIGILTEAGRTPALPEVTLHSNPGQLIPEQGLVMTLPVDSPYYSPNTGIDKESVVRDAVRAHDVVAFAGDGPPDLPAALLVPPERRFARGWLAHRLRKDGVPFREFDRWSEVAVMLLAE